MPGLAQSMKDPVLPQATVKVANAAQIPRCYGCGIGQQLQIRFNSWPGNFLMPQMQPKEIAKKKTTTTTTCMMENTDKIEGKKNKKKTKKTLGLSPNLGLGWVRVPICI